MPSMKYTSEEVNEQPESICAKKDEYPYGLRIDLDKDSLKKLGIIELPPIGARMSVQALVEVVHVSESEHKDGEIRKNVDLQITDMELGKAEQEKNPAEELYGVPRDPTKEGKAILMEG